MAMPRVDYSDLEDLDNSWAGCGRPPGRQKEAILKAWIQSGS